MLTHPTLFLSHNAHDKPFVGKVARALGRYGIVPWLDERDLPIGVDMPPVLESEIKQAAAVALFVTKQAMGSSWVDDELAIALKLEENEQQLVKRVIPIFLGDKPLALIGNHHRLRRLWLNHDQQRITRLGASGKDAHGEHVPPDEVAKLLARAVFQRIGMTGASSINIKIDQRGEGPRTGAAKFLPDEDVPVAPTLVFRPNTDDRSQSELLLGDSWLAFTKAVRWALGRARHTAALEEVRLFLFGAQLGLALLLGQQFNRTNNIIIHAVRGSQVFCNASQPKAGFWLGGNEHANVEDQTHAPPLAPGKHPTIDLMVMRQELVPDVTSYRVATASNYPAVLIQHVQFVADEEVVAKTMATKMFKNAEAERIATEKFENAEAERIAINTIKNVVAVLLRLKAQHGTRSIRLFTTLPVHALALLGAALTNIINHVTFMEYRRDVASQHGGACDEKLYTPIPLTTQA